ncbi:PAS domain-containing protein [Hydrogenophaga sp.]|uniref:PAS domain-containing protein n=1 Tax=Hydrogenophaga sp. TaxID=1904254 RepID=UPI003569BF8D
MVNAPPQPHNAGADHATQDGAAVGPVPGGMPYEQMFQLSPLPGSLARKQDGKVVAVNEAWVALTGLRPEQVVGRRTDEFPFWNDHADRAKYLAQLPSAQQSLLLRFADGALHRLRLHTSELVLGGEIYLLVFMQEVTREHEAEAALERVNLELQQRVELLEASEKLARIGHWTNDADDKGVLWSPGLYDIAGLDPQLPMDRTRGRGRIHPDDLPAWNEARQAKDGREIRYRWAHPDGETRWLRTRIGSTAVGNAPPVDFGVVQDVTSEHLASQRQANQLTLIQSITANMPGLMYQARLTTDGRTQITFVNDAVREILEIEPAAFMQDSRLLFSRVHPDDLPGILQFLRTASRDLTPWRHVTRVVLPNRGLRWCSVVAVPQPDTDGSVLWHGFIADVTESVLASQVLERQHHMLEAVQQAQTEFIEANDKRRAFEKLLEALLVVTGSEYGFVGEVLYDAKGQPYLKTHAITNIAWDEASRRMHAEQQEAGMEFRNLHTLFGHTLVTKEVVIANDPANDPRSGGRPSGHPSMNAYLGIPILVDQELVGMVGLANRSAGYAMKDVELLQPLLGSVRQLVRALRHTVERQRTQQQLETTGALLAEKSRALQDTLDSISQGLIKVDADGRTAIYNRRVLELLNLPEALLESQPTHETIVRFQHERGDFGENLELIEASARAYLGPGPQADAPEKYWRSTLDGRTLEIRTRRLDDGGMVRTYTDVSSYFEAQEALRSQRQRLEWVLEATRPGIWETDLQTRAMKINARWGEMLGYTQDELEPATIDTWIRLLHPEDAVVALRRLNAHWRGQTAFYECYVRILHKDGHWVWINDRGRVHQRDASGRALYMSGTHLDISDRVGAQEEARALNAGLEQRVAQRTADLELTLKDMEAISYSIAHDLRAPLRAVNGFAAMIAEEEQERMSPSGRDMFARIVRSSRNMGQMLTDMLSMLQVVRVELDAVAVDMNAVTHAAIEALASTDPRARVDAEQLPPALGDATLLRQVLLNLLDNALKYSRNRDVPRVQIGYDAEQRAYFMRDNGVGFDMAHASKLFGLFQRLHAGSDVPGMGVGLAIVSRIIERHTGRIWAESQPGRGTTFWWTLPAPSDGG